MRANHHRCHPVHSRQVLELETEDTIYRKFLVIRQLFTAMTTACALSRFFANRVMQHINDAY